MGTLPRPLLALLVAVVAAFAAWTVALKPSSNKSSANSTSVSHAYQQAVANLHRREAAKAKPAAHGASATAAQTKADARQEAARRHAAAVEAKHASAAKRRVDTVITALRADKVIAVLFYNPSGADDQADLAQLKGVATHKGKVVTIGVPLSELTSYSAITDQVPVQGSPTLVVIDRHHRATTLVGFADQLEMNQLVDAALAAK